MKRSLRAALGWMEKQAKANKPFFLWYNSTAMHFRTHLADKNRGKSGQDDYSDRMVTHDEQIGQMLDKLDELGIADNTIVMYSTDNGPENDTWPDGANTPFRSQKDTNWEGAWRVPAFLRWPGKIKAGTVLNGIVLPPGHVADVAGSGGRSGRQQETPQRLQGRGQDVQGAHRRDQHAALSHGPGEGESQRTSSSTSAMMAASWRSGTATRSWCLKSSAQITMEVWAEPLVKLRVPHHIQLASRSLRARRFQLQHLLGLGGRSRPPALPMPGTRGGPNRELRQVPASPEGGLIQP